MRTILVLLLLAGGACAAAAESGSGEAVKKDEATEQERQAEDREALAERQRRVAENLKRFSWVEVGGPPEHRWVGEPISLSLRDADLVEVLRSFAKMTDVNLVIDPSVKGKVTVELRDVPWDQALYVIMKSNGLGLEISGNVWSMMPAERLPRDDQ